MDGLRSYRPPIVIGARLVAARAVRLGAGVALAWPVALAIVSPLVAAPAAAAAATIFALALWRPAFALILLAALVPGAQLLARDPVRAAEMLVWAFLAASLLRVWRPLSPGPWPRSIVVAAFLYTLIAVASWLTLTIRDAGGIDPAALPLVIARSLGADHLIATSPEPETGTMLLGVAGIGMLLASIALVREQPQLARRLAATLALSMAALSVSVLASVAAGWAAQGYAWWWLARYPTIERSAIHLLDVNAAGSQYVMAGLAALGLAIADARRRWFWGAILTAMLPGIWISGSRSAALTAAIAGIWVFRSGAWKPTRPQIAAVAMAIVLLVAGAAMVAQTAIAQNTAGRAMRFRIQFTQTSARMFASAPTFGVGIGRYHGRSGEFMPAELRAVYEHENAHNYFAQQFAELGLVGGLVFLGLMALSLRAGWENRRRGNIVGMALFAASAAYLATCTTGHPLLVPEAALPFAIVLGAAIGVGVGTAMPSQSRFRWSVPVAAGIALLTAGPVVRAATTYGQRAPAERGFYGGERDADGRFYRWTTRHAVTSVQSAPGFLTLVVNAAKDPTGRPFELQTEIDGQLVDRREIAAGAWTTIEIPLRPRRRATAQFRRVDLRVNRTWMRHHKDGERTAPEAVGVMVAELRWTSAFAQTR